MRNKKFRKPFVYVNRGQRASAAAALTAVSNFGPTICSRYVCILICTFGKKSRHVTFGCTRSAAKSEINKRATGPIGWKRSLILFVSAAASYYARMHAGMHGKSSRIFRMFKHERAEGDVVCIQQRLYSIFTSSPSLLAVPRIYSENLSPSLDSSVGAAQCGGYESARASACQSARGYTRAMYI